MSDDSDYSADFTGSDDDDAGEELSLRDALVKFYKKHAPGDEQKVDNILTKYAGREAVIFKALRKK
jgi:hypothetical protein